MSAISFYRLGLGDASLVYANILNLSARILYTMLFTLTFFRNHRTSAPSLLVDVLPDWRFVAATALSYVVISLNQGRQDIIHRGWLSVPGLLHFSLGIGMGLVCVAAWWMTAGRRMIAGMKSKVE